MSPLPFRFAVQAIPQDGKQWLAAARHAEELGYSALLTPDGISHAKELASSTLLMPDGMQSLSPLPALALAAGATASLRVGTFVLASPLRPPRLAAWDAHTLSVLTAGRFELGIGTGRPEVVEQSLRLAGQPPVSAVERLARAEQTIDALRTLDEDRHTPVLMAAAGPKARTLAAAKADIVTFAVSPLISRDEMARLAAAFREEAGDRVGSIEFAMPVFVVGDEAPAWVQRYLRADLATLAARDSLMMLRGTPRQMADELQRRRDAFGVSYVNVIAAFTDQLAPVVDLLAGR